MRSPSRKHLSTTGINNRQLYRKFKPKAFNQMASEPLTLTLKMGSKEDLRNIITDHILQNIEIDKKDSLHANMNNSGNNKKVGDCSPKAKKYGCSTKKNNKNRLNVTVNYPTIPLIVSINGEQKSIKIDLLLLLRTYLKLAGRKDNYNQSKIEPMIVDILNFIDTIQEEVKHVDFHINSNELVASNIQIANQCKVNQKQLKKKTELSDPDTLNEKNNLLSPQYHLQMPGEGNSDILEENNRAIVHKIISLIIQRHIKEREKNKNFYGFSEEEFGKKIIVKNTKVSFIDLSDNFKSKEKQYILQISDKQCQKNYLHNQAALFQDQRLASDYTIVPSQISEINSQLHQLIKSGQLFQKPEKLQELKKNALIKFYGGTEAQYSRKKSQIEAQVTNNFLPSCNIPCRTNKQTKIEEEQNLKAIRGWLTDIGISQTYYNSKFGKSTKHYRNYNKK